LVDIVVGGYPCQPVSLAGVRRGDKDDRWLWPEMLRIIEAVRPTWVIGENVAGHITMGLDTVLSDLEAEGYQARCFVIPAVAADARHRRDRCWVVAHAGHQGFHQSGQFDDVSAGNIKQNRIRGNELPKQSKKARSVLAHADSQKLQRQPKPKGSGQTGRQPFGDEGLLWGKSKFWKPEPAVGRVANGVPGRVHRLKQLGNSIVPQVAARILWAIKEAHDA